MKTQILTVSSKGQISLPSNIRRQLSIDTGDKLAIYASEDVIMLKVLRLPTEKDFEASLEEAREWAASVGYDEKDIEDVVRSVRTQKQNKTGDGEHDCA